MTQKDVPLFKNDCSKHSYAMITGLIFLTAKRKSYFYVPCEFARLAGCEIESMRAI